MPSLIVLISLVLSLYIGLSAKLFSKASPAMSVIIARQNIINLTSNAKRGLRLLREG